MSVSATPIEWADATWNPTRGCSRISAGCEHCYAETIAARFSNEGNPFHGFARRVGMREAVHGLAVDPKTAPRWLSARWTGHVALIPSALDWPLRWRGSKQARAEGRPSRIFVNSMSDLFHERLSDEDIAAVFGVMAKAQWHTFLVLTKRAERLPRWFEWAAGGRHVWEQAQRHEWPAWAMRDLEPASRWPLPNVWLGVSVEDQATADERIPELLATPAAVRFVSVEPILEEIELDPTWIGWGVVGYDHGAGKQIIAHRRSWAAPFLGEGPALDWVIVGGESGPRRRDPGIGPLESIVEQCRAARVPVFVKQDAGPRPGMQGRIPDELWQVREFPEVR